MTAESRNKYQDFEMEWNTHTSMGRPFPEQEKINSDTYMNLKRVLKTILK